MSIMYFYLLLIFLRANITGLYVKFKSSCIYVVVYTLIECNYLNAATVMVLHFFFFLRILNISPHELKLWVLKINREINLNIDSVTHLSHWSLDNVCLYDEMQREHVVKLLCVWRVLSSVINLNNNVVISFVSDWLYRYLLRGALKFRWSMGDFFLFCFKILPPSLTHTRPNSNKKQILSKKILLFCIQNNIEKY